MSHSEVINTITQAETDIKKWTDTNPIDTWSEIINQLVQESLHPNHYLIFEMKKMIIKYE